jgi:hypothetical protein
LTDFLPRWNYSPLKEKAAYARAAFLFGDSQSSVIGRQHARISLNETLNFLTTEDRRLTTAFVRIESKPT